MEPKLAQCLVRAADPIVQMTRVRNVAHSSGEAAPTAFVIPPDKMLKVELYDGSTADICLSEAASKDSFAIPATIDREGYFGDNHLGFWVSGLVDYLKLEHVRTRFFGDSPVTLLDLGCATGRFLRHPAAQGSGWSLIGCDIDEMNIDWVKRHLGEGSTLFQNTVYPHLPLPDCSVDIITAFSVFTHLDKLEDAWLLELRRVLRPGGILYLTAHTEEVWADVPQRHDILDAFLKCRSEWSLPKGIVIEPSLFTRPMPDHAVLRFESAGSYVSQTFHSRSYIQKYWGRIYSIEGVYERYHNDFQTVVVMKKR